MNTQSAQKQRGVALLVVLILLVMMSALAAKIGQQFCRNLQKTRYQVSQHQLRWAMQGRSCGDKIVCKPTPAVRAMDYRQKARGTNRWKLRVRTIPS